MFLECPLDFQSIIEDRLTAATVTALSSHRISFVHTEDVN
jgi:hypothetical protein